MKQVHVYLKRLQPILKAAILVAKDNQIDSRLILRQFMIEPNLYESIPDFMHCITTNFLLGQNESYVESIGSILKQHFLPNRNLRLDHLEEEVIIHWNGPSVPHCDDVLKETIDRMHGSNWHFLRKTLASKLKFHKISKAVDTFVKMQNHFTYNLYS